MSQTKLLTSRQLQKAIKPFAHLVLNGPKTRLVATFDFDEHVNALVFIAKITVHAEVANHHPDIIFKHQKVKVTLYTHDAKGITKKDITLAKKIENFYQS